MLTTVYLDGEMGKQFGKKWELAIESPAHALRLINANKPGLFAWIRANLNKYANYQVVVTYKDGRREELVTEEFPLDREMKSIRFVPVVQGSSAVVRVVIGIVLIIVGAVFQQYYLCYMGAGMVLGGIAQMLTNTSKKDTSSSSEDNKPSYIFNGAANTTDQGVPVQLIYGDKVLVGSHAISAALTVDQLM